MNFDITLIEHPAVKPPPEKKAQVEPRGKVLAVVLALLTPLLYLVKLTLTAALWVYLRFIHDASMSSRERCPACGVKQEHEMHYAEDYERVIHVCARCKAEYGLPTVIPVGRWRISRPPEEGEGRSITG